MDQFDENYDYQSDEYQRSPRRQAQPTRRSARPRTNSATSRRTVSSRGTSRSRVSTRQSGGMGGSGRGPIGGGEGFSLEAVKPYTQEIMIAAIFLLALISILVGLGHLIGGGGQSGQQSNAEPAQEMTAAERLETAEMSTDERGIVHGTTTDGINFTIRGAGSSAQSEDKVAFAAAGSQIGSDTLLDLTDGYGGELGDGTYDFSPLYSEVSSFVQQSDLRYMNQDTVLAGTAAGYSVSGAPAYNSPESCADAIAQAGFNLVSFDSSHALDAGAEALAYSQDVWAKYPDIIVGGSFKDQNAAETVQMIERNGIRFAFLSYNSIPASSTTLTNNEAMEGNDLDAENGQADPQNTDGQNAADQSTGGQDAGTQTDTQEATADASASTEGESFSSSASPAPATVDTSYAAVPFSEATASADIERAKKLADVVIVSMYWGSDRTSSAFDAETGAINVADATSEQRSQAKWLADQGVDLVVGTHVHGIQPIEWVASSSGKNIPVAYGLGDFVSGQTMLEDVLSGIFTCDFKKGEDGSFYIENAKFHPTIEWDDGSGNPIRVRLLENMTEEEVNANLRVADEGNVLQMIYQLTTATIKNFDIEWGKLADAVKAFGAGTATTGEAADNANANATEDTGVAAAAGAGAAAGAAAATDDGSSYYDEQGTYDTSDYSDYSEDGSYDDGSYYQTDDGSYDDGSYDNSGYDESYDDGSYDNSGYNEEG